MRKWFAWILVLGWMGVIFYLSHHPADASSKLSSGIVQSMIQLMETITRIPVEEAQWLHFLIRKGAHVFAYFLLAILLMHACIHMDYEQSQQIVITLIISVLYAISDEMHQLFIPGRSGEVRDVLIDTAGAILGILVWLLFVHIYRLLKSKENRKKSPLF